MWRLDLDAEGLSHPVIDALSAVELERARRFRFDEDRQRFVVAHVALRSVLAGYLDETPASVVFSAGPSGKPALDPHRHGTRLRFNLSHSHDVAVVAVACDRDVGIDVERIRPMPDFDGIVARFFSASERAALGRLPEKRRLQAFFECWTRKEACLKAAGLGIGAPLDRLDVGIAPRHREPTVHTLDGLDHTGACELLSVDLVAGYTAAVAVMVQ